MHDPGSLRTADGRPLVPGELLGRGGEARVYALANDPDRAVKVYGRPDPERIRKLEAMLARVPADPDRRSGHVSIAWPQSLALDSTGRPVGFVMPRVDARRYLPLHQLYHPRSRRSRAPGIDWRYLVRIARNLCGTVAALHDAGYVVGDLNESNILVDDRALVTLVDLDSIQVTTAMHVFRCNVGKAEYTPPELLGRSFRETNRRPSADRFALAVLVFMLLMEGNHPFSGVYGGAGEPPDIVGNILSRRSPYFGARDLVPPPAAPPMDNLGASLAGLLRRGLLGHPWRRPDARALGEALADLEEELVTCDRKATHSFRAGLPRCPWCARTEALGSDPYPLRNETGRATPAPGSPGRPVTSYASRHAVPRSPTGAVTSPGAARHPPPARTASAAAPRTIRGASTGTSSPATPPAPAQRPSGFRGSWGAFLSRSPAISALITAILASPPLLWYRETTTALAGLGLDPPEMLAAVLVAALAPPLVALLWLYGRARNRAAVATALFRFERLLRALVGATVLSVGASVLAGATVGRGSVLAGDWLLLPALWTVSFVILLRRAGPKPT